MYVCLSCLDIIEKYSKLYPKSSQDDCCEYIRECGKEDIYSLFIGLERFHSDLSEYSVQYEERNDYVYIMKREWDIEYEATNKQQRAKKHKIYKKGLRAFNKFYKRPLKMKKKRRSKIKKKCVLDKYRKLHKL